MHVIQVPFSAFSAFLAEEALYKAIWIHYHWQYHPVYIYASTLVLAHVLFCLINEQRLPAISLTTHLIADWQMLVIPLHVDAILHIAMHEKCGV